MGRREGGWFSRAGEKPKATSLHRTPVHTLTVCLSGGGRPSYRAASSALTSATRAEGGTRSTKSGTAPRAGFLMANSMDGVVVEEEAGVFDGATGGGGGGGGGSAIAFLWVDGERVARWEEAGDSDGVAHAETAS